MDTVLTGMLGEKQENGMEALWREKWDFCPELMKDTNQ